MNDQPSRLWLIGPPISLMLLAGALYVKVRDVRLFVDRTCPSIRNSVGKYAPPFLVDVKSKAFTDVRHPAETVRPTEAAPAPAPTPTPKPFDLPTVCADSNRWPKTVSLNKVVEFPAVIECKVVGKVKAPAGSEARVVSVRNGKIGVEYRGGGAWLEFGDTDFVERARHAWK